MITEVGSAVKADDVIAKIETDKVTVDILAAYDGVITKYHCELDDTVPVGAPFCDIDPDATASAGSAPAKQEAAPAEPAKVSLKFNIITPITFRPPNQHQRPQPQPLQLQLPPPQPHQRPPHKPPRCHPALQT